MALDLSTMTPTAGNGLSRKSRGRTTGPNPFLEQGLLYKSYEEGQDYWVGPFAGAQEEYVIGRGDKAGQTGLRWTGEVAEVISLIRRTSNELQIGVAVDVQPAKHKGHFMSGYLGKERKQRRDKSDSDSESDEG